MQIHLKKINYKFRYFLQLYFSLYFNIKKYMNTK